MNNTKVITKKQFEDVARHTIEQTINEAVDEMQNKESGLEKEMFKETVEETELELNVFVSAMKLKLFGIGNFDDKKEITAEDCVEAGAEAVIPTLNVFDEDDKFTSMLRTGILGKFTGKLNKNIFK